MNNEKLRMMNSDKHSSWRCLLFHSSFFILHSSKNLVRYILILLIRLYRCTLSPAKTFLCGPLAQCRFTPSCSEYALEALQTHGIATGSWLALKRICRCHPWGKCGHDPVPSTEGEHRKVEVQIARGHCC
jgi:putative membrane protein insertion efficiency factor